MKKEEIIDVTYSFDHLCVLGVYGNDIYLKGNSGFLDECVIKISKTLFKKSLDLWLEDKQYYCELCGHFCGASGSIRSIDYEEMDSMEVGNQELKVYKFNSIDDFTDMEHG